MSTKLQNDEGRNYKERQIGTWNHKQRIQNNLGNAVSIIKTVCVPCQKQNPAH